MFITIVSIVVLLLIGLFHWHITKIFRYWQKRGVLCLDKTSPYKILYLIATQKGKFIDDIVDAYNAYPERKFYAVYDFFTPTLLIRDPELISTITVKDFDYYVDHRSTGFDENIDPLWGKGLFFLKGKRWHEMRRTLSPAFTGSKMRGMFDLMSECSEQVVNYINEKYQSHSGDKPLPIEFRDLITRFTNDVIATTAFGIKTDSFKDPKNEFYEIGRTVLQFKWIKFLFAAAFPKLFTFLGLQLMPSKTYAFFRNIIKETIKTRTEHNIYRPDMIHLLMEARKELLAANQENGVNEKSIVLSDDDITAQCFLFFVGGFESVSSLLCFSLYEMALNPDIQQKLQAEIDTNLKICNGKVNYDTLKQMKYLDAVVSETLRKWSPNTITDRYCTKRHVLKFDNEELVIEPGTVMFIPIFAIQRDAKYFPNPEKFDPDRFSDENKNLVRPFTYAPFGYGPRICIASRFALVEAKLLIFYILAHFNLEVIEKTPIPMILAQDQAQVRSRNGYWIGVKPRKM